MIAMRIALLLLVLAFGASAASAKGPDMSDTHAEAAFAEADTNGDGRIDPEEFHLRIVEIFFFVDIDRDGYVSHEEIDAATLVKQDMSVTDRNGDGRISLHEFVRARFVLYRDADLDEDHLLSLEEVQAAAARARKDG